MLFYVKKCTVKMCRNCGDKYRDAATNNVQRAGKLLETGFEYVCSHKDEMPFRKRK